MEFLFLMCSVNSNVKLRQLVLKFVFFFPCLISSIWLNIHFLKPFFALKNHSFFMEYFFQKCSWQQFLKNQVSVSTEAYLKPRKLNGPFLLTKLEKPKQWNFYFYNALGNLWMQFHTVRQVYLKNFTCIKKIMRLLWQKMQILHIFHGHFWGTLKKHWHWSFYTVRFIYHA